MKKVPNVFQRSTLWMAITALSITVLGALLVGFIYLGARVISLLQPILIPFAIAGVLAYLLEPVVARLVKWRMNRKHALLLVFQEDVDTKPEHFLEPNLVKSAATRLRFFYGWVK